MIEYKIVCEAFDAQITTAVNGAIADGWKPMGGIQVVVIDQYFNQRYCQAMIRDTAENAKRVSRRTKLLEKMSDGVDEALEYAEENQN